MPTLITLTLPQRLKRLRKNRGWTRHYMARRLYPRAVLESLRQTALEIRMWEHKNEADWPSDSELKKIADLYGVDPGYLQLDTPHTTTRTIAELALMEGLIKTVHAMTPRDLSLMSRLASRLSGPYFKIKDPDKS